MKILVLNSGSSSLKYQFIEMPKWDILAEWIVDKIWLEWSNISHKSLWNKINLSENISDHKKALDIILNILLKWEYAVIKNLDEINAVWHRVVHGWEEFTSSVIVNDIVLEWITKCEELAPLHNPANKQWIIAIREILPNIPQVVVFDTAFHQTIKPENYLYALPYKYYTEYKIRRYGFHGTSHKYVSSRAAEILGENVKNLKIINCHIWNWASIAAIDSGEVVDTSMWFTPLEWLIMWTRSWDLDPAIITFLMKKEWLNPDQIDEILNKKSWILWITEQSSDMRDVVDWFLKWDERLTLALNIYINRIVKYIGAYTALMGWVDVITLTAWVLENSSLIRKIIVDKLQFIWVKLNESKNDFRSEERIISTEDSKTKIIVIPTNEELVIAQDTYYLLK